jgi:hypothetical protein
MTRDLQNELARLEEGKLQESGQQELPARFMPKEIEGKAPAKKATVFASAAGVIIGMKPAVDIDCKHKAAYETAFNYCVNGDQRGVPKEFIGKECDKSMVSLLRAQVNLCKG